MNNSYIYIYHVNVTQTVPDISPLMPMHQDPLLVCLYRCNCLSLWLNHTSFISGLWCGWVLKVHTVTVLSKVENLGSPNGPTMVDCWVVRVTFGWSVYMIWSEITMKQQYLFYVVVSCISTSTKRCKIDILSYLIALKFHRLFGSNIAKSPAIFQSETTLV